MDERAWRCDCEHHCWYVERLSWDEVGRACINLTHTLISWLFKLSGLSFLCQPHGSCQGGSRQLDQESGHRVGSLWNPCQCCSTSECRWDFILHTWLEVCPFMCVYLYGFQGTIFSKTAMENYKDLGPQLFRMSVSHCPAKRLGVPEEVCNCRKTLIGSKEGCSWKKKKLCYILSMRCFGLVNVSMIRYHQQCVSYSHLLPPTYLEPPWRLTLDRVCTTQCGRYQVRESVHTHYYPCCAPKCSMWCLSPQTTVPGLKLLRGRTWLQWRNWSTHKANSSLRTSFVLSL